MFSQWSTRGGGTEGGGSKDVEKSIENLRKISERWGFSAITSKNLVIKVKSESKKWEICAYKSKVGK